MYQVNSSLIKKEKAIKELQYNDPTNPELFTELLNFCEHFMRWKKWQFPQHFLEEIATDLAEQMFFRIQTKGPIDNLNGYVQACRKYCFRVYYQTYRTDITVVENSEEERRLLSSICDMTDGTDMFKQINCVNIIESIPNIINEILEHSKYFPDTKEYLNAKLSLCLSLSSNHFISYNQDEREKMYTNMLYRKLYDRLKKELESITEYYLGDLSLLQLYTLSLDDYNEEY